MENRILCCDWGTSSFRMRLVNPVNYAVTDEIKNDSGIGATYKLATENGEKDVGVYARVLKEGVKQLSQRGGVELRDVPVIISGMASSSIGMTDVPYAGLPFPVDGRNVSAKLIKDSGGLQNPVILLGGVRSDDDVMRGEETQLTGLIHSPELNTDDAVNLLIILPGTHSKHMFVSQKMMTGFQTFMTGELFQTIGRNTILKDSISVGSDVALRPGNLQAFTDGVGKTSNINLLHSAFFVRTNQLFEKYTKEQNTFFLSGLLIGNELRQIDTKSIDRIVLCSDHRLLNLYAEALTLLGLADKTTFLSSSVLQHATISGQILIYNRIKERLL